MTEERPDDGRGEGPEDHRTALSTEVVALEPPVKSDIERTLLKYEEAIPPDTYIQILTTGNFSKLQESECAKFLFIHAFRKGLDPWRQPFIFIVNKDGKRILYPRKEAATQLRQKEKLTARLRYAGALRMEYEAIVVTKGDEQKVELVPKAFDSSIYETVWDAVNLLGHVVATDVGTADIGGTVGNERKNQIMSAYTRGKRRVILDAAGLGDDDYDDPAEKDEDMPRRAKLPPGPKRQVPKLEAPTDAPSTSEVEFLNAVGPDATPNANSTPPTTPIPEVPMKKPSGPPKLAKA